MLAYSCCKLIYIFKLIELVFKEIIQQLNYVKLLQDPSVKAQLWELSTKVYENSSKTRKVFRTSTITKFNEQHKAHTLSPAIKLSKKTVEALPGMFGLPHTLPMTEPYVSFVI